MSNRPTYEHDWGDDSAALFRSARRAHDPTPLERATFGRVLARIEAGNAAQPSVMGSGAAPHGAAPTMVGLIGKISLAVLGIAAAYFAFSVVERDSSAPRPNAAPLPAASAAATADARLPPQPRTAPDGLELPLPPSAEADGLQPTRVVRHAQESRAPGTSRRLRANAERQPPAKRPDATVVAGPSEAPKEEHSAAAPEDVATTIAKQADDAEQRSTSNVVAATTIAKQADDAEQRSTSNVVAATREPARRESSGESRAQQAVPPTTPETIVAPRDVGTELDALKRMQAALRAADFTTALALCAEHERRWPHGKFELERQGVQAIAACGVNSDGALSLAKRFLASHPRASVAMRVSSACRTQLQQVR